MLVDFGGFPLRKIPERFFQGFFSRIFEGLLTVLADFGGYFKDPGMIFGIFEGFSGISNNLKDAIEIPGIFEGLLTILTDSGGYFKDPGTIFWDF